MAGEILRGSRAVDRSPPWAMAPHLPLARRDGSRRNRSLTTPIAPQSWRGRPGMTLVCWRFLRGRAYSAARTGVGCNPRGAVMIYDSILGTIGRTPIVRINRLAPQHVTL